MYKKCYIYETRQSTEYKSVKQTFSYSLTIHLMKKN